MKIEIKEYPTLSVVAVSVKRSLQRMQHLMNKNVEETLRVHSNDLDFLMKTTDVIEHFFYERRNRN